MAELYTDIDEPALLQVADECLLNYGAPFAPSLITSAHGVFVTTSSGHRILDWTSGQMSTLLGHGHREIVETIASHAAHLDHLFSAMLSPPVVRLAQKLTGVLPEGLDKAMFLSTGGESNEAAIKLAKLYTGRWEVVGLAGSWHGVTMGAYGVQFNADKKGYGPMMPGSHILPMPNSYRSIFRHPDGSYDWEIELDYGWSLVDRASAGSLAAVIMEPILSSAGMLTLPPGYLKAMKAHCERRGMLLIVDEAQTGMGRCGEIIASTYEGVTPDILTLSKTLGNGLPLSAVVTSNAIAKTCQERGFLFYTTHVNDPLPAAVGLKTLEIILRDKLLSRSKEAGKRLHNGLHKLESRYGCIGDVRGRGLMAGIEIVADRATKEPAPELGSQLAKKMYELGLSANIVSVAASGGVFRMGPPITITDEELDLGLEIMEEAFRVTPGTKPLYSSSKSSSTNGVAAQL